MRASTLADGGERRAPRLAGGDQIALLVGGRRQLARSRRGGVRLAAAARPADGGLRVGAPSAAASSSAIALSASSPLFSALPCQPSFPSIAESPLPFSVRATSTVGRPLVARASSQAFWSVGDVVAVDHDRVPAEGAPAGGDAFHVVAELGRLALPERVDVDDRAQVVELVVRGRRRPLPTPSLRPSRRRRAGRRCDRPSRSAAR